ncbi:MAG: hypothetical protein GEU74_08775 [Nitriliruptorales bacterium]|nr:hypothetical protein [Nitriliruptorales bacterium]
MSGATGVMAIILLETAVGASVLLWASGVWGVVRRGFFLLTGITAALCAAGAWAITASETAGSRAATAVGIFTAAAVLWQVLLLARQEQPARWVGLIAAALGVVALVLFAEVRDRAFGLGAAELVLGALFLGSTAFGLLLGHWYLVERRLTNRYMIVSSYLYAGGVVAAGIATAIASRSPAPQAQNLSPLLALPSFTLLLAGGFVAICALIAPFVWKLANEGGRSIQAATGYFYLAVIMAFSAEMAAKLRFF